MDSSFWFIFIIYLKTVVYAPGIFFSILGRGPRAFQIGKINVVNPLIGKTVIVHNHVIFGQ